jgi:hypothetical protein
MKSTLLLLLLAWAAVLAPTRYEVLGGRFGFDAPADWREATRLDTDSVSFVAFAVPRPGGDSKGPAVNVMIDVVLSHRHWDLKTFGDAKLNQLEAGPGNTKVIDDRSWPEDHSRTALAQGVLHGVPYAVWDKLAVRDSIYLDLRTAVPAAFGADSIWEARYSAQLDSLIASFHVGTELVFSRASPKVHR